MSDAIGPEGVHRRGFRFCQRLKNVYTLPELFVECRTCNRFFIRCCERENGAHSVAPRRRDGSPCHHWPVVYTDGACLNNGALNPRGGIGYAFGRDNDDRISMPWDSRRSFVINSVTSQKMELIAAIRALQDFKRRWLEGRDRAIGRDAAFTGDVELVVATDSQYVATGITEWFPVWRNNGFRNRKGKTPANTELFYTLDNEVNQLEASGVAVGFIHIPREINTLADSLAKDGANRALIQESES